MAKHRAPETIKDLENDEITAEVLAIACRTYAAQEESYSRRLYDAGEWTAAAYHAENKDAATTLAMAWEWVRVSLWETRRGALAS
jgi:hypothetical protein